MRARCIASGLPDTGNKEALRLRLASARRRGLHVQVRLQISSPFFPLSFESFHPFSSFLTFFAYLFLCAALNYC